MPLCVDVAILCTQLFLKDIAHCISSRISSGPFPHEALQLSQFEPVTQQNYYIKQTHLLQNITASCCPATVPTALPDKKDTSTSNCSRHNLKSWRKFWSSRWTYGILKMQLSGMASKWYGNAQSHKSKGSSFFNFFFNVLGGTPKDVLLTGVCKYPITSNILPNRKYSILYSGPNIWYLISRSTHLEWITFLKFLCVALVQYIPSGMALQRVHSQSPDHMDSSKVYAPQRMRHAPDI